MAYAPLGREVFARFHQAFRGDTPATFDRCAECGGQCEYSKVSSLLPGEAEFIAGELVLATEDFRHKYLDGVLVDSETIDVLKCSDPCPFLDPSDYSCHIRDVKPLMCLIYPIVFEPDDGVWKVGLDPACPLSRDPSTAAYFQSEGKGLVEGLRIPSGWLERVYQFDEYGFDYRSMLRDRNVPIDRYKVYPLQELLKYRV